MYSYVLYPKLLFSRQRALPHVVHISKMRSQQQQIYDSKVSFCLPQLICLNKHLQIPDLKPAKSQRVVGTVGVFRYQHTHWPLGSNVMAFNRSNVDRY